MKRAKSIKSTHPTNNQILLCTIAPFLPIAELRHVKFESRKRSNFKRITFKRKFTFLQQIKTENEQQKVQR
jgi:hypothetical protein